MEGGPCISICRSRKPSGDVTPDLAATVTSVLEMRRKALEAEVFELRLLVLEEKGQKR
jgi:hypothetical protein